MHEPASVMSKKKFNNLFPGIHICKSEVALSMHTGESMTVLGEIPVKVSYHLPTATHTRFEAYYCGRIWSVIIWKELAATFRLDWISIKYVLPCQRSLTVLLGKYHQLFENELGNIKPYQAKLSVASSATPRYHQPRSMPLLLRTQVDEELDSLERIDVFEKVEFADWAAPIIVVPKKDGRVRIYGDYKVTVTPVLEINQYPLPQPDNLFATLAGGKHFTIMDLSHAYNQLTMDESSCQYLTINTYRGLYRYTHMPFGVTSAPAIFQKMMDIVLQGMKGVIYYIDILVAGGTEEEYLSNLDKVLHKLQTHAVRVKNKKCHFLQSNVQYLGHVIDSEGIQARKLLNQRISKNWGHFWDL